MESRLCLAWCLSAGRQAVGPTTVWKYQVVVSFL